MSKIDDQIKELQVKKRKVEFLNSLKGFISNSTTSKEFSDVKKEIEILVNEFVENQIKIIEDGEAPKSENPANQLADNEVVVLKDMVTRFLSKTNQVTKEKEIEVPKVQVEKQRIPMPQQDKISFALANRHLDHKRVKVITQNGNVSGIVCGLDAPNVVVKTDNGYTIEVTLDKIII